MFDDEQPGLESEEERSGRHARMVTQALVFSLLLSAMLTVFGIAWAWFVDGVFSWAFLWVFPGLMGVLAVGMFFELRKRW